MREGAKQRLLGAVVIVALVVIFVPMLFEQESLDTLPPIQESIPQPPAYEEDLKTEVFLGPEDSGVGGLGEGDETVSESLALPAAGDLEAAPVDEGAGGPESGIAPAASASSPAAETVPTTPPADAPQSPPQPSASTPASGGAWVVQVASLASPDVAAELEGRLRRAGFSAFVERAQVNGRLWYRVRVGPQRDRPQAEQVAALLRERHRLDTLIQHYP